MANRILLEREETPSEHKATTNSRKNTNNEISNSDRITLKQPKANTKYLSARCAQDFLEQAGE